jgi:hypothetical protein
LHGLRRQPGDLVVDLREYFALLDALTLAHRHSRYDTRLLGRHLGLFQQPEYDGLDCE